MQPGSAGAGCPGLERVGFPRGLSITLKQAADDWMDWSGKGSTRPPPAARARVHQGDSEDLGMAAQEMATLLKVSPRVGTVVWAALSRTAGPSSSAGQKQQWCQPGWLATGMLS